MGKGTAGNLDEEHERSTSVQDWACTVDPTLSVRTLAIVCKKGEKDASRLIDIAVLQWLGPKRTIRPIVFQLCEEDD
ncbi:hypothetical protein U0070_021353, partial [Myodes glareolus]